jgi:ribulose bisphosphate carboxylase small subunit
MLGIFTKPVETLTAADVDEVLAQGWPEGYEVEYKEALPTKNGRPHAWTTGGTDLDAHARDEILSEIVAFANTQGGTLVLGIGETHDKPPRATAVVALQRVGDLARRFEDQARSCIEPPLPLLRVQAVETAAGEGVVVFRTGPSRTAPHRLTTNREAYKRHGSMTVRMDMRDIQEMTLNTARGLALINDTFATRRKDFHEWLDHHDYRSPWLSVIRATAVPLAELPDPGRLYARKPPLFRQPADYKVKIGQEEKNAELPLLTLNMKESPILRGVQRSGVATNGSFRQELRQSGGCDIWASYSKIFMPDGLEGTRFIHLWQSHVITIVLNILDQIDEFRSAVGVPDAEYALEVQLGFRLPNSDIGQPTQFVYATFLADAHGTGWYNMDTRSIVLPHLSVGPRPEFNQILNTIDADIFDAIGAYSERLPLEFDGARRG